MQRILPLFCGLMSALGAAAVAVAGGGGHAAETYTFVGDWLPRLVNFAILAAVLVYFLRKPARDFFKSRSAEIARSLQESREARERAAAALAEMERKVKEVEAESNRMIDEARTRGERDKQSLLDEGKKVAAEVQAQVRAAMDIELRKAKDSLAVEASLLAIDLAEGTIKENIKKPDHDRILKEYIESMGGRG